MNVLPEPYQPLRAPRSEFIPVRHLSYHILRWGEPAWATPERPLLVLTHGWMDVAASYQFLADALARLEGQQRCIVAVDWRGFGKTDTPLADCYWFPDYIADLDALVDTLSPHAPVDLVGHSMGGNVVMSYAGVRPQRVRRLVNLEGFGLPASRPTDAPARLSKWLDELREPVSLRPYASVHAVAERLCKNNPLLKPERAAWLAHHWAEEREDGLWHVLGHPAHKRTNPVIYRVEEVLAAWDQIRCPLLFVEGDRTDVDKWWGQRYPRAEFEARIARVQQTQRHVLSPAGHMLHHDQPEALAARLCAFLSEH